VRSFRSSRSCDDDRRSTVGPGDQYIAWFGAGLCTVALIGVGKGLYNMALGINKLD